MLRPRRRSEESDEAPLVIRPAPSNGPRVPARLAVMNRPIMVREDIELTDMATGAQSMQQNTLRQGHPHNKSREGFRSKYAVEGFHLPSIRKIQPTDEQNKKQSNMASSEEDNPYRTQLPNVVCAEWNERPHKDRLSPLLDAAHAATIKLGATKSSVRDVQKSIKESNKTPNSPGVQKLEDLNRTRHSPIVAYENEPFERPKVTGLMNKTKNIGVALSRNIDCHHGEEDGREQFPDAWCDHSTTADAPDDDQDISGGRRAEIEQWLTDEEIATEYGTSDEGPVDQTTDEDFFNDELTVEDFPNASTATFHTTSRTLVADTQPIMALSTANLKKFKGVAFDIAEGRFSFTHCPGLLNQEFYVSPPPSEADSERAEESLLRNYFRRFKYNKQEFHVVPTPRPDHYPPYKPLGPHRTTGLALQEAVGNCIGGDESIVPNPGGNAVTNAGFHLFLESDDELEEINPNLYLSDYYRVPLFEEKEPDKFKKLLWRDLGRAPSSSSGSESSTGYAPSFEPNVLTERQGQTPASAMILFLLQRGFSFNEICSKLGPLDTNFLYYNATPWYRGKRLPDINVMSLELIDRICEYAAAEPESWELPSDKLTPMLYKYIAWKTRDRKLGYWVVKVVENYLHWRLQGRKLHRGMPVCPRLTKYDVS